MLWVKYVLILCSCLLFVPALASPPRSTGMVTDTADLLPDDVQADLEAELLAWRDQTSIEIAVLIVPSLEGKSADKYTRQVWTSPYWKIGQQADDNGVLLLVVPPPEKVAWIATGYGLKPYLSDTAANAIVNDVMHPFSRDERRVEAVQAGVHAIIEHLGTTPWAERTAGLTADEWTVIFVIVAVVVGVAFILFLFWLADRKSNRYGGGGGSYSSGVLDGYLWGSSSSSHSSGGNDWGGFSGGDGGGGGGGPE